MQSNLTTERRAATNSSYKKLAVQWLLKALCFVAISLLADNFVLRNPPAGASILLVPFYICNPSNIANVAKLCRNDKAQIVTVQKQKVHV